MSSIACRSEDISSFVAAQAMSVHSTWPDGVNCPTGQLSQNPVGTSFGNAARLSLVTNGHAGKVVIPATQRRIADPELQRIQSGVASTIFAIYI
jgi:hypothetical protein